ncbi:hypothetical protein EAJ17_12455 [Akkermansia sp. aa_0143]|nr:hypothetical protein EAJ17_12455 [Akkermansia sp. aa_0143]
MPIHGGMKPPDSVQDRGSCPSEEGKTLRCSMEIPSGHGKHAADTPALSPWPKNLSHAKEG